MDSPLARLAERRSLATVFLIQFTTVKLANKMPAAYLHGATERKSEPTDGMLEKETDINHLIYASEMLLLFKKKNRFCKQVGCALKGSLIGNLENEVLFSKQTSGTFNSRKQRSFIVITDIK